MLVDRTDYTRHSDDNSEREYVMCLIRQILSLWYNSHKGLALNCIYYFWDLKGATKLVEQKIEQVLRSIVKVLHFN